ncbi:zinc finger MYND domain-containing protein 10-like [Amphiura filiformis]|uniref:zinc finger MYND domain-containing protein 10-like n=1 Tax=Amphiura filiformis TaxID=82378 RepID=UPI003B20C24D
MASDTTQVLLAVEAEAYIEALEKMPIKDVGSPRWMKQHEYLEKLNMQAVLNASANEDEFIKEMLVTHEKIPVVIHELLSVELWRQKVFSIIQKMNFDPKTTFPLYMALYHEATLANLLETILYHREPCESAEDCVLDLVDYCHRKITHLIARQEDDRESKDDKDNKDKGSMEELKRQDRKLQFDIGIKAVSILRYITDHVEGLPLSVTTRILNTHDIPSMLVQLIESPPWTVFKDGKLDKFIDNKWQSVPVEERLKLTRIEGQVWIALFNLLMGSTTQEKYEFNTYNKNQIIKLRAHLSEVILDQIPSLCDLQRYLEHLAMMDPPAAKSGLVLEQVPEVRDLIIRENDGKWGAIAKHQVKTVFNPSSELMKQQAKMFADTYNFDVLESLIQEPPKCAMCGELAAKRCSRCQNEWYCRRECQVKHWTKHKQACNLLAEAEKKLKEATIS